MVCVRGGAPLNANVEREGSVVRFHATSVSASVSGDYYQLSLGPTESGQEKTDPYDVTGPYLIVQRQFEMPDHGRCYVETHDESYIGHFPLRLTEFSRTHLAFEIVRESNNHVVVSFVLDASEFERAQRIAEVIFGLREPESDDEDAL